MEYRNLKSALHIERVNLILVAECIGVDEKTVRNKIEGRSKCGFLWDEAWKIKRYFLNKYDPEWLFARDELDTA